MIINKFRLNAKYLYLKYEGIKQSVTKGDILKGLNPTLKIKEYLIATNEKKKKQTVHILIVLHTRCNITKRTSFNLKIGNKSIEGTYQVAKEFNMLLKALTIVDEEYLTNMPLMLSLTKTSIVHAEKPTIAIKSTNDANKELEEREWDSEDERKAIEKYHSMLGIIKDPV